MPDFALIQSAETALEDTELNIDQAKGLMGQMVAKIKSLESRLFDYEDTNQIFSPE